MPRHDPKLFEAREPPTGLCVPHLTASRAALNALYALRRCRGRQAIVLASSSAQVSVAHVRDEAGYFPQRDEVRIATLAGCPVYATPSCVESCPHDGLVLDVHGADSRGVTVFVTRPESRVERQDRIFRDRGSGG